eukprot:COSAG06_NODE_3595_length_5138_cov_116.284382_6_plen_85_part_00
MMWYAFAHNVMMIMMTVIIAPFHTRSRDHDDCRSSVSGATIARIPHFHELKIYALAFSTSGKHTLFLFDSLLITSQRSLRILSI